jgi:chromosome segregation ATPase
LKEALITAEEETQRLKEEVSTLKEDTEKLREDNRRLEEELVGREGELKGIKKELDKQLDNARKETEKVEEILELERQEKMKAKEALEMVEKRVEEVEKDLETVRMDRKESEEEYERVIEELEVELESERISLKDSQKKLDEEHTRRINAEQKAQDALNSVALAEKDADEAFLTVARLQAELVEAQKAREDANDRRFWAEKELNESTKPKTVSRSSSSGGVANSAAILATVASLGATCVVQRFIRGF